MDGSRPSGEGLSGYRGTFRSCDPNLAPRPEVADYLADATNLPH
jgi:hypothetical protein